MTNIKYDKDTKVLKDKAQVDITVKVKPEEYSSVWEKAAQVYAKNASMPGFRKGKVPMNVVKANYSNEIAERAFNMMVDEIVQDLLIDIDNKPISTVRIAVLPSEEHDHKEGDNHEHSLQFMVSYAYRENPKLPDLEKVKVKRPSAEVSEDEVNQSMDLLLKSVNEQKTEGEEIKEWDEESIQSLKIDGVKTLEDLRNLVKDEIEKQKNYENEIQYRATILDEIIKLSNVVIPQIILEDMLLQQEDDYKKRIEKLGFEYDKYLEEKNINMDELRKEWEGIISSDLARELVISQYVMDNEINPTDEEIDQAIQNAESSLKERYTPEGLRQYMKYVLANNIAFGKIYAIIAQE